MNTIRGAKASASIYSIAETARLNNLSSYYYVDHLLTELPKLRDENGNIDTACLDHLLPWSETLLITAVNYAANKLRRLFYRWADYLTLTIKKGNAVI